MTRFLLTMLALLTGLTVSGGSAEARICGLGGAQVGMAEAAAQESRPLTRESLAAPVFRQPAMVESGSPVSMPADAVPVATVCLQADRARE